ncbi:SMP-30/gluconolactonase/LRE family protein [Amycolatopsis alkalitolerans]|uniref:SMP-30/gluconolactonase/LRE family protein n=1 Tax=Amycolatopsis alkalitolerans TaxID=2547244 RepID=UPI00190FBEF0|nr:SMP-30/gluconolactonase/LRE family protein [Amycolatopsis alkalitolerans]
MKAPHTEIVLDIKPLLGEGALWDTGQQRLYWIDSLGRRVFRMTADGRELRSWLVPAPIGSMALTHDAAGAVVALANGVHLLDFATGETTLVVDPEHDRPDNRLNDGKVDRRGATSSARWTPPSATGTESCTGLP